MVTDRPLWHSWLDSCDR